MRTRMIFCAWLLAGCVVAGEWSIPIADFEGVTPLAGWAFAGVDGSLVVGPGHTGQGAVLQYRFTCSRGTGCGTVAAMWTPARPLKVKRKAALSLWVRAMPEVRITFLVRDGSGLMRRYPFEATTLEHPSGEDWQQAVIPLAAKSTGYGDEDHTGALEGRVIALGVEAEARYPQAMRGAVSLDDVRVVESPDETFPLRAGLPVTPAAATSAQLRPRLGVNIHTLADEPLLDRVHDAGFSFVRMDLLWRQVERNGRYRFFGYDRLLTALEARGMGALWILDYGHPQHGNGPPRSREDRAAFAQFAEAAAAHYKGRKVRYEIWNEPNLERFWPPFPKASEFSALLRDAVEAIHRADPSARVASGGLARIDLPFLEETILAGGISGLNAAGVHPYRRAGPESVAAELTVLRQSLDRAGGERMELWDTEWGYASYDYFSQNLHGDGHSAVGRKRQAVLASRQALTVWALGLPVAVWYDLRDDGDNASSPEHNYGLLDESGADKPAMQALRTLTEAARDHAFAGMVQEVPDGVHAMRLDASADQLFAVWSEQPDSRITVRFPTEGFISATNLMGDPLKPRNRGHGETEIALPEVDGPVYVKFRAAAPAGERRSDE
jgi:Cellulase (glycosyl hydrolase family 5)